MIHIKRHIAFCFVIIGLLLIVIPVIPHHHHNSAVVCMKSDLHQQGCPCDASQEHESDPCCTSECITNFDLRIDDNHNDADVTPEYLYFSILYTDLILRTLSQPLSDGYRTDNACTESLYIAEISLAKGLRAPPCLYA